MITIPDNQYPWRRLNNSLLRRIGTLNCGHAAFPIIMGVNEPQYTPAQLEAFRQQNEEGVTFEGRHYTTYEATQKQRQLERNIRRQKRRILVDEATGDEEKLQNDQIRLQIQKQNYARFSKGTGLPMQHERMEAAGFDWKKGNAAQKNADNYYKYWAKSIGANKSVKSLADYYDMKYNRPEEYRLLQIYAKSIEQGMLSPIANFETYKKYYESIQNECVGKAINETTIAGQADHFLERVFGCKCDPKTKKPRDGTPLEDVFDCLNNPVEIQPTKVNQNGERSFVVVGHRAKVSINPDTGILIQTNPWRC